MEDTRICDEGKTEELAFTSLRFPASLWLRVGIQALRNGSTKNQFVEDAIMEKLGREEPGDSGRRQQ